MSGNNPFGLWNSRETSNSEYGKFAYQNNVRADQNSNMGFGQFSGWNYGQQHYPGCKHYNWDQRQGSTEEQQPQFTVQIGEEAAIGGQSCWFQNSQPNNQTEQLPAGVVKVADMVKPQGSNLMKSAPSATSIPCASTPSNTLSQPQSSELRQQSPSRSSSQLDHQPLNCPIGGDGAVNQGGDDSQVKSNPAAPSKTKVKCSPTPLPTKWKGLPPKNQCVRQTRPAYIVRQQQQQESAQHQSAPQPQCYQPTWMGTGNYPMTMTNGCEDLSAGIGPTTAPNCKIKKTVSTPFGRNGPLKTPPPPPTNSKLKPKLCGTCPKCKDYLPPVTGPSVMNFPVTNISKKPSAGSVKTFGQQQGGKNFRAFNLA